MAAMKRILIMKKVLAKMLVLAAVGLAPVASGFNYSDSDLLLVFRQDGFNDVEFDLGSVSNYLGLANGTKVTVSGWDLNLVKSNYNNSLSGVKFILVAATSLSAVPPAVWCSSAELAPATPPTDLPRSQWGNLQSKFSSVGTLAAAYTFTNSVQAYVITTTDASSYTSIASDGGQYDAGSVSGFAPFTVESDNPGTVLFYRLKAANRPQPAAALIGSFTLDASGVLTFTAGPLQQALVRPSISIQRVGTTTTVSFPSVNNQTYQLWYLDQLGSPWSWTSVPGTVSGNGLTQSLTDTTSGSRRFYQVRTF